MLKLNPTLEKESRFPMTQSDHVSYSPMDAVQRAADAAIRAAEASLATDGARLEHLFIMLHAEDVPAGEFDACTARQGFKSGEDLLAEFLTAVSTDQLELI